MSDKPSVSVIPAILTGQIGALTTLVGLLIDKGVLSPEEVVTHFDRAADVALASDGGSATAQASQAIADFVRGQTGAGHRPPS